MEAKLNGGPAFPTLAVVGDTALSDGGLTVRDYFAAKAMPALIHASTTVDGDDEEAFVFAHVCGLGETLSGTYDGRVVTWAERLALDSYALADAMLAARASGEQPPPARAVVPR